MNVFATVAELRPTQTVDHEKLTFAGIPVRTPSLRCLVVVASLCDGQRRLLMMRMMPSSLDP